MPKGNREAKKPKKEKPKTTRCRGVRQGSRRRTEEVGSLGRELLSR